jgi:hypothetical protein
MHTLRQKDGLSGYTSRSESEYDPFGAGHGCNSISAGIGKMLFYQLLMLFLIFLLTCLNEHPVQKFLHCISHIHRD